MAQMAGSKNYWSFVAGYRSEGSPLSFPENASLDEENFELLIDGSRRRRKGLIRENSTSFNPDANYYNSGYAFGSHDWKNPGSVNGLNFVVTQTGRFINFFTSSSTYNNGFKSFSLDLNSYKTSTATTSNVEQSEIDTASGKGKLLIVGKYIEPLVVSYDSTTDDIIVNTLALKERDFEGLEDGLGVQERPATLSSEHNYNLQNQGWTSLNITAFEADTSIAGYPSNSDIESLGYIIDPSTGKRIWSADDVVTYPMSGRAPRGHFIREVFNPRYVSDFGVTVSNTTFSKSGDVFTVTTSSVHGFTPGNNVTLSNTLYATGVGIAPPADINGTYSIIDCPTTSSYRVRIAGKPSIYAVSKAGRSSSTTAFGTATPVTYRPTSTAFFAGRAWYAGIESDKIGDTLYFSQLLDFGTEFDKCYQVNDPTAEEFNQLLATDGGTIKIPGMGSVRKLVPLGSYLLVFSNNGVWAIGPGDKGFFQADSFSIKQVCNVGCSSKQGVVVAEGTPIYWSDSGIYGISEDKTSGFPVVQSISGNTIQTFYNGLGATALAGAKGVYDDLNKRILWLYSSSEGRILGLDLRLNAFFKWRLVNTGNTNAVPLQISSVINLADATRKVKIAYRDVIAGNSVYYWADFTEPDFLDYGVSDAAGFLETGYELLEDARKPKFTNYVHVYLERTETGFEVVGDTLEALNPSSCYMQARWDWANSGSGGKFTTTQQVYRYRRPYIPSGPSDTFDTGERVIVTKNRVRGTGKALHLRFTTEAAKDCHLYGWTVGYTGVPNE